MTSELKKNKYKAHPLKIQANKVRRISRHIKSHPKDKQSIKVLEKL